ncbi:hypothetical protein HDU96_000947 [Phlyctochytrium bullatum]|nr:hypothetical protein HDU96_000947 [Phlyctochytrium bullatum]
MLPLLPSELWQRIFADVGDLPTAIDAEWLFRTEPTRSSTHDPSPADSIDMFDSWTSSDAATAHTAPFLTASDMERWSFRTAAWVLRFMPWEARTFAFGNLAARHGWVSVLQRMREQSRQRPETLRIAAEAGNLEAVRLLAGECGLFVPKTAVLAALQGGHRDVFMYLIGTDEVFRTLDRSMFNGAARGGNLELLAYFMDQMPNHEHVDCPCQSMVFDAVCIAVEERGNGNDVVEWCLALPDMVALINETNPQNLEQKRRLATALAYGGRAKALRTLITADPSIVDRRYKRGPCVGGLQLAIEVANNGAAFTDTQLLVQTLSSLPDGLHQARHLSLGNGEGITAEFLQLLDTHVSLNLNQLVGEFVSIAARHNRLDVLEWLLARPELERGFQSTFMYEGAVNVAAERGAVEVLERIVENVKQCQLSRAMDLAVDAGRVDSVLCLLDCVQRYPDKVIDSHLTPKDALCEAVRLGRLDMVAALIKAHPAVDRMDVYSLAVEVGHVEIARLLVDAPTRLDALKSARAQELIESWYAAATRGDMESINALLQACTFTAETLHNTTSRALEKGYLHLVLRLITALNAATPQDPAPFEVKPEALIRAAESGHWDIVRCVLGLGGAHPHSASPALVRLADTEAQNRDITVRRIAQLALDRGRLDVLAWIFEAPAFAGCVDVREMFGQIENEALEMAWYLGRGVSGDADDGGAAGRVFWTAAKGGRLDLVRMVVRERPGGTWDAKVLGEKDLKGNRVMCEFLRVRVFTGLEEAE